MKYAQNHGTARTNNVENRVGKAVHERATDMMMNFGERFWMSLKCIEYCLKGAQEVLREGLAAIAIPGKGFSEIGLSLGSESNRHSESVSRDRIVDQGCADSGSSL